MTTRRQVPMPVLATAFVLFTHMVLQCSGKAPSPQIKKFNAKYRVNEEKTANQSLEATTIFPVNPYVFSAEDYDILQDAENLQQALSVVSYESQKIGVKKNENGNQKSNTTLEKSTQPSRTTTTTTTTQVPPEKKYYEVPRKQSRTKTQAKPKKESSTDVSEPKLAEEASSLRHAYEPAPQSDAFHQRRAITPPAPRSFSRNNQEPPLPLYPPLTERTPLVNFGAAPTDNYQHVPLRSKNSALDHRGLTKPTSEPAKTETGVPTVKKKRRKPQRAQQPTQEQGYNQHQQQKTSLVTNDRIPRPFALPTDPNPTAQTPVYPTKTVNPRQNIVRPTSAEQIYHFPTNSVRQNIPKPTVSVEPTNTYSSLPLRQNVRTTIPTRQQQTIPHSTEPVKQEQTIPYSTVPVREEPTSTYQRTSLRRNTVRHNTPVEETEAHANLPATRKAIPVKEEQPIVYTIPRRREQANARSNVPLRQEQEFSRATAPTRQEQGNARTTIPGRREQPLVRTTVPTKQEQTFAYGSVPPRQDQVLANPTVPARQERTRTYTTIPRQEQPLTYSTVPDRQEQGLTYQPNPQRRNNLRQSIPTVEAETHSSVPPTSSRIVVQPSASLRQTSARQNVQYEDDFIPPTVPVEQGYPTIAKPTYVPKYPEYRENHRSAESDSDNQENNEHKEYANNDNYNDYNNDNDNDNDNNNNNDKNDDNHGYSYSHIERIEEPLDGGKPIKTIIHNNRAYQVTEDDADPPEYGTQPIKTYPVLQRGGLKRVEPDYDQNRVQYVDLPPPDDPDYDQARGQNVQLEVAEPLHHLRGDEEDLVEQANHHHKEHHKPKKHSEHHEEGGAKEHHEGEHHEHGEKGEKGYKSIHEHDEGKKGHHDKEGHDHHYDEKEGKHKKHHDEAGFHEEHEKGEEGEKKAAFSEKGDHKKGHSTHGEHVIHKKDEFEKKTEFFDEFHEGGDVDKDGGYHEEHHHKKGGHHKKGHHHEGHHEGHHGKKGKYDKGHHHHEKKGHDEHEGHDHHHHHEEKHGKKGGHADAKHWHHKKGERR